MKFLFEKKMKSDLIRLLLDSTPIAYIILDEKFRIHYINDSFLKLRKLELDSTIGELCYNISNAGTPCAQCAVRQALDTGKKAFIARKDTLSDGSVKFIDDYAIPISKSKVDGSQYIIEIMVNRTQEMLIRERRDKDYEEVLSILASLLETKDQYTAFHSKNVKDYALKLARAIKLSDREVLDISIAASLHDIGKVHVPSYIITKNGKLEDSEYNKMKSHPEHSYLMLEGLSSLDNVKHIVRHHHERIDGKGYPDGLKGDELSLGAKIVAIADTYDAMTSTRPYRTALSHEYAIEEIKRVAGTQLDKTLAEVFVNMDFSCPFEASTTNEQPKNHLERIIGKQSVKSIDKTVANDFHKTVNEDVLLEEIFNNTPCGYVVLSLGREVLFASQYFLDYMGLTSADVMHKLCYDAAGVGASPCPNCAIERAKISKKVEYMRQEQQTPNGLKIFDLFGIPMSDEKGNISYVIEVIIDRTEEALLERTREQSLNKLISMLTDVLQKQEEGIDEKNISEDVINLTRRLNQLLYQKLEE